MATPPRADFDPLPPEPPLSPDTRCILVELGKLSGAVVWLVETVKQHGEKIDALRDDMHGIHRKIDIVKGMLYAVLGMIALASLLLGGKFEALTAVIKALAK